MDRTIRSEASIGSAIGSDVLTSDRPDQRFGKSRRVVRGGDFTRLIGHGSVAADATLVVFVEPAPRGGRMGVTIPKRTGGAVVRNRWKRHIRDAYRRERANLPPGWDVVIRPKKGAVDDYHAIQKSMRRLIVKAIRRFETRRPMMPKAARASNAKSGPSDV